MKLEFGLEIRGLFEVNCFKESFVDVARLNVDGSGWKWERDIQRRGPEVNMVYLFF